MPGVMTRGALVVLAANETGVWRQMPLAFLHRIWRQRHLDAKDPGYQAT